MNTYFEFEERLNSIYIGNLNIGPTNFNVFQWISQNVNKNELFRLSICINNIIYYTYFSQKLPDL